MDTEHRATVRRYLLGEATDEEREALEGAYFEDESALSRVESEEETLIEEYLAERLDVRDRDLFQERYLASPIQLTVRSPLFSGMGRNSGASIAANRAAFTPMTSASVMMVPAA